MQADNQYIEHGPVLSCRAADVYEILQGLYDDRESMLDYRNAWELLVAVALSAQTTDDQVNRVTPALFTRWPGPADLADVGLPDIEDMVRSTGYYRNKAKNIREAARCVRDEFAGTVPDTMEELVRIPGIGRKSAGVILHHIWNKPAIIVDTHFGRVVSRLGLLSGDPSDKKPSPLICEREIATLLPPERWSSFSMLANLHGRRVCGAKNPDCPACSLQSHCEYFRLYVRSEPVAPDAAGGTSAAHGGGFSVRG